MRQATLQEYDTKIRKILMEAKKTRQSWFNYDRVESPNFPMVSYSLYKSGQSWCKLTIADEHGKVDVSWDIEPEFRDAEIESMLAPFFHWQLELAGFDITSKSLAEADSIDEIIEKKIEFDCSQEKLLETIKNLNIHGLLNPYNLGDLGELETFGYTRFLIQKEQAIEITPESLARHNIPENAKMATLYENIGYITIGKMNNDISLLILRNKNPELLQFFDRLLATLRKYDVSPRETNGISSKNEKASKHKKRKEINLQTAPPGRHVDPWNPVAFDMMNDGKESANLRAFDYWCNEHNITARTPKDRKAFKLAMKREGARRTRNRGTK